MSADISPEDEVKLVAEVESFKFGQAARYFNDHSRLEERDLKVGEWTKYRDGLPLHIRRFAVIAYRQGYGETTEG